MISVLLYLPLLPQLSFDNAATYNSNTRRLKGIYMLATTQTKIEYMVFSAERAEHLGSLNRGQTYQFAQAGEMPCRNHLEILFKLVAIFEVASRLSCKLQNWKSWIAGGE